MHSPEPPAALLPLLSRAAGARIVAADLHAPSDAGAIVRLASSCSFLDHITGHRVRRSEVVTQRVEDLDLAVQRIPGVVRSPSADRQTFRPPRTPRFS
jgi:hypothetical protein